MTSRLPVSVLLAAACCAGLASAQYAWRPIHQLGLRQGFRVAYDPLREVIVLFGGSVGTLGGAVSDTWIWDGHEWRHVPTATTPPARYDQQMAYDYARRNVVMFGGWSDDRMYGDMWEWTGEDWRPITSSPMPGPRIWGAMAGDPVTNKVLLYGGVGSASGAQPFYLLSDTWEWDGVRWVERFPASQRYASAQCSMAFNPVTQRMTLWGGHLGWDCVDGSVVHEWDGTDWVRIDATGTIPPTICANGTTDPLFRGVMSYWGRLYLFDGASWTQMPLPPRGVAMGSVSWDLARRTIVGISRDPYAKELHHLRFDTVRGTWTQRDEPKGEPNARSAYDAFGRRLIFGANWTWSEAGWERLPSTQAPYEQVYGMVAQHPSSGVLVYAADGWLRMQQTWVYDGTDWQAIPFTIGPLAAGAGPFVADPNGDRLLLLLGTRALWEWTPTGQWRHLQTWTSPDITGLGFDAGRNRFVGVTGLRSTPPVFETWEWDGQGWTQVVTANTPPPDGRFRSVYAPAFGGIVLVGHGVNAADGLVAYRYDGQDWAQLPLRGQAPPFDTRLSFPSWATYDASRKRILVSYDGSGAWPETLYELVIEELSADREILQTGQTVTFRNNFPSEARKPWLLLLSESNEVGVVARPSPLVGAEVLPLDMDPLLLASLASWMGGVLNHQGQGSFALPIPNSPALRGLSFHGGAVVIGPGLSIDAVSNGVPVQVAW